MKEVTITLTPDQQLRVLALVGVAGVLLVGLYLYRGRRPAGVHAARPYLSGEPSLNGDGTMIPVIVEEEVYGE